MQDKKPRNEQGKAHGLWETYWTNGNLNYKGNYTNGLQNGYCEQYYYDYETICYQGNFINGFQYGYYISYWKSGIIMTNEYHAR